MIVFNKKMGILGGMGPEATAEFYLKVIRRCQRELGAKYNSDFPSIIINSTQTPDGKMWSGFDPKTLKDSLENDCKILEKSGIDFIVIPCNSAHFFIDHIRQSVTIPVLSIIEEVTAMIRTKNLDKVLLLSTRFTSRCNIYNYYLANQNIQLIKPIERDQEKIEKIIVEVESGNRNIVLREALIEVVQAYIVSDDIQGVILGCTELPLICTSSHMPVDAFDTLEVLADSAFELIKPKKRNKKQG